MSEEDWLDEQLLADDPPSPRRWRRDATGMDSPSAMKGVPRYGQLATKVPIADWRRMKAHIDGQGNTLGRYIRNAIGARMVKEGVPAEEIEGFIK